MAGVRAALEGFLRDTSESFGKLRWYEWVLIAVMVAIAIQRIFNVVCVIVKLLFIGCGAGQ